MEDKHLLIRVRPTRGRQSGFKSPEGDGVDLQSAREALSNLGKAAVTGGLEEVVIYIIKLMMNEIAVILDEKYSIKSKAAKWGEKVVSRAKARIPHTPLSLPATLLVDTLNQGSPAILTE